MKHQLDDHVARQSAHSRTTHGIPVCMLFVSLTLSLSACGNNPLRPKSQSIQASRPISVQYTVRSGDSLVKIAKQITGSGDNWSEIAAANRISDPKSMQVGLVLIIPSQLIPASTTATALTEPATTTYPQTSETTLFTAGDDEAFTKPTKNKTSRKKTSRKDWIFQPSSLPGEVILPVILHRATANRTFKIFRTEPEDSIGKNTNDKDVNRNEKSSRNLGSIKVMGSYYPKGIYSQPSYSSTLLMRVAPGTRLRLEESIGDWLQIRTEKGSGYIRAVDAEIMSVIDNEKLLLRNYG